GTGLLGLITERLSAPNLRITLQSPARTRSDRQHRIAHFSYLFDLSHKKHFLGLGRKTKKAADGPPSGFHSPRGAGALLGAGRLLRLAALRPLLCLEGLARLLGDRPPRQPDPAPLVAAEQLDLQLCALPGHVRA